jgi:hypothetical protein
MLICSRLFFVKRRAETQHNQSQLQNKLKRTQNAIHGKTFLVTSRKTAVTRQPSVLLPIIM